MLKAFLCCFALIGLNVASALNALHRAQARLQAAQQQR